MEPTMLYSTFSLAMSGLSLGCIALLLAASMHDLAARTVPNGIALALALLGLAARSLDGHLIGAVLAALATFIIGALCWRRGWLGGGDVKLLAAAALAVPPADLLTFFLVMSWAGAALAIAYLIARRLVPDPIAGRPRGLPARALRAEWWRIRRGGPLPYACAIAVGGLFVLL